MHPVLVPDDSPWPVVVTTVVGVALDAVDSRMKYPPAMAATSSTSAAKTSNASLGALPNRAFACMSISPDAPTLRLVAGPSSPLSAPGIAWQCQAASAAHGPEGRG